METRPCLSSRSPRRWISHHFHPQQGQEDQKKAGPNLTVALEREENLRFRWCQTAHQCNPSIHQCGEPKTKPKRTKQEVSPLLRRQLFHHVMSPSIKQDYTRDLNASKRRGKTEANKTTTSCTYYVVKSHLISSHLILHVTIKHQKDNNRQTKKEAGHAVMAWVMDKYRARIQLPLVNPICITKNETNPSHQIRSILRATKPSSSSPCSTHDPYSYVPTGYISSTTLIPGLHTVAS